MTTSKVQVYMDALVLETLLSEDLMVKNAQSGVVGSLIEKIKSLISDHINPNDKAGSIVNILAPSIIGALGFPITGIILEIAESWFGLNIANIMRDAANEIKSLILGDHKFTSSEVEGIANRAVQNNASEPTQSQFENALHHPLDAVTSLFSSNSLSLREARLLKVNLLYIRDNELTKTAGLLTTFGRFVGLYNPTTRALASLIKWIAIVGLWALGLLAVDDAAHSILGSPSKTDFSAPSSHTTEHSFTPTTLPTSTQTVFKVNPAYQEERFNTTKHWIEPVSPIQIGDQIVQWAQNIYPDTKSLTDEIKNTAGFNQVVQAIDNYNRNNTLNITFMPPDFTSRKKVVDSFMDELAQKAPLPQTPTSKPHISEPM